MKKLGIFLLLAVMAFFLASCKGKDLSGGNSVASKGSSKDGSAQDSQEAIPPEELGQKWPVSAIYDIPEWQGITRFYGKVTPIDDFAGTDNYFLMVDASTDSLDRYLDTLKNAGYEVTDSSESHAKKDIAAEKGLVRLEISSKKISNANSYQIDFDLKEPGTWPDAKLPDFLVPIKNKMLIDDPVLYKPGSKLEDVHGVLVDDEGYNFQFTYTDMMMDDATKYMNTIVSKLGNGTYSNESPLDHDVIVFIKGTYPWNGRTYHVYGEAAREDKSTYAFYFGWSLEDQGW